MIPPTPPITHLVFQSLDPSKDRIPHHGGVPHRHRRFFSQSPTIRTSPFEKPHVQESLDDGRPSGSSLPLLKIVRGTDGVPPQGVRVVELRESIPGPC